MRPDLYFLAIDFPPTEEKTVMHSGGAKLQSWMRNRIPKAFRLHANVHGDMAPRTAVQRYAQK
jgi:hypothetical protein